MGNKIRFAVIGCGRIAYRHIEILANQIEDACLVAVCDLVEEKAKAFGEKYSLPFYTDYVEMFKNVDIDAVCVLTESGYHAKHVIDVASFKKHIIVEKPMALTLDDADAMIEACNDNNVKLFVVKQNRYNLPVKKLRSAVEEGRFGKLVMGTVRVRWCREQKYYDQDAWRGTWALDGGVFTNQASHHIDLLEWMMGEVESVFAKSTTRLVDIETEDTGVAVLKFANGALGIIEATTATRPKDLEGSISILGEKGSVEIGGFAVNEMKVWNFVEPIETDKDALSTYKQNPPNVYGFGHLEYLKEVVDAIKNNKQVRVDGKEGRKSILLINAIYESIETGREIKIKFKPEHSKLGAK
jgi:UDP-N-acetyl-2-amino-2-deoxyglucuronate dehydrogenase